MPKTTGHPLAFIDNKTAAALARLLPHLSSRAAPLTPSRLEAVLATPTTRIIVGTVDGEVVGMALLYFCTRPSQDTSASSRRLLATRQAGGHHVGIEVMVTLLEVAADLDLDFVELTSRKSRQAANSQYQSLGFERRGTNVYGHTPPTFRTPLMKRRSELQATGGQPRYRAADM